MKRKILPALLFLSIVSAAAAFPAQLTVGDRTATMDDPAVFNLTVENTYAEQERFRISSILSPPVSSNWFDYEYSKKVPAREKRSFLIRVTPNENAIQQNYAFTVNVRSLRPDELVKRQSYVSVENRYDLSITSFQLSKTEARPGQAINISATVKNTASRTLDDFRVEVAGLDQKRSESGTVLGSSDSIRYNFRLKVPEGESPGNKTVTLAVFSDGERQQYVSQDVKIEEIRDVRVTERSEDRILVNSHTVRLDNEGNVAATRLVNRSVPVYLDPLVTFDTPPASEKALGAEQRYTWKVNLGPGETEEVSYTVNYIPALGFLALLFVGIVGLKKLQTDIKFSKSSELEDGAIKISIEVENNSGTPQRNLEVKDFVPDIAEVSNEFDFAKPVITKTSSGTRLSWGIDKLEPGEQRVFEYRINPIVEVEDGAILPEAEISSEGARLKESSKLEVEFRPE